MTAPEATPAWAVNTRRTQLTRVPVMSCWTLKGPKMVAMLGIRLPRNWAATTRATPMAVTAIHFAGVFFSIVLVSFSFSDLSLGRAPLRKRP